MERAVRESEEKHRAVFENTGEAINIVTGDRVYPPTSRASRYCNAPGKIFTAGHSWILFILMTAMKPKGFTWKDYRGGHRIYPQYQRR